MPVIIADTRKATSDELNHRDYSNVVNKVSYEGAVIGTYERNGYHDSDFYAIVWDEDEGRIRTVEYATTRGWTYLNRANVDITPENLAKATEWAYGEALRIITSSAQEKAETVEPGKVVRLVSNFNGRKQASAKAGEEAQVTGVYDDSYDYNRYTGKYGQKASLSFADGRQISLKVDKLEVVDPGQYLPETSVMEGQARNWAERESKGNFRGILEGWLYRR